MNATMSNLSLALAARGFDTRTLGAVLFSGEWGIHCGLTGSIQARNVRDSSERFYLGNISDSADSIAEAFARVVR